jgi:hypothetical protein
VCLCVPGEGGGERGRSEARHLQLLPVAQTGETWAEETEHQTSCHSQPTQSLDFRETLGIAEPTVLQSLP